MAYVIDESQRRAATVVGVTYLFAMAASMFTEGYVRGTLIVSDNAVATAQNVMAHATLFRAGIAIEILTFASDITLISALYVILAPVNRHLALYAAFLRMAAVSVGAMMAAHSFDVLRLLGSVEYLRVFQADQLAALARVGLGAHTSQYNVVFVFLGLGSTVFACLWVRSRYVPKPLALLGVGASVVLAAGTLAFLVVPALQRILFPAYMAPMFAFEVGMGLWLLVKGLRPVPEVQA
jgi:hypothetical protein